MDVLVCDDTLNRFEQLSCWDFIFLLFRGLILVDVELDNLSGRSRCGNFAPFALAVFEEALRFLARFAAKPDDNLNRKPKFLPSSAPDTSYWAGSRSASASHAAIDSPTDFLDTRP